MAVLVANDGGMAERLERTEFDAEKSMRDMLLKHPDMIPVYEINENVRLLTIKRELRVLESESDKFADAVAVDKNGSIYLIETKLFRNPDKRQVVAQVLSYGASLWSSNQSSGDFMDILNESCLDLFDRPFLTLVREFFSMNDEDIERFRDTMSKNWDDGVFKFVVYMDRVADDLRSLVTYINKRSRFDLYLVGVDYYNKDGIEIIIPKLYGVPDRKEVEACSSKKVQRPAGMSKDEFFRSAMEKLGDEYDVFQRLYELLKSESGDDGSFRANTFGGSFTPKISRLNNAGPFSLKADGTLQIYLNSLEDKGLLSKAKVLREGLVKHGFVTEDSSSRQPMIKMTDWVGKVDELTGLIRNVINGA